MWYISIFVQDKMKKESISIKTARKIVLNAQMLEGGATLPQDKEGLAAIVDQLGYIQIDTLSVVKRSHHLVPWTRFPGYHETMLHELHAQDRRLFEFWGHAMCYLPMADYRYFMPRMRHFTNPKTRWAKERMKLGGPLMEPILERIRKEGPLSSKDLDSIPGAKDQVGEQWSTQVIRIALDNLFWQGELMVKERQSFRKVFDLTERVLPEDIDTTYPEEQELGRFFVQRALKALGLARENEITTYMQPEAFRDSDIRAVGNDAVSKELQQLVDAGAVLPVEIEGENNGPYYALAETIEQSAAPAPDHSRVFLLSPFDNMIIRRDRTRRLFNFDYALECYVPPAKRKYGYFVMPVLWGDSLVARLDPKADRKKKTLFIRNLVFEPQFEAFDPFLPLLGAKLLEFARFNQCEAVKLEKVTPAKVKKLLIRHL
jgi:uncharacterized protein YcaQ